MTDDGSTILGSAHRAPTGGNPPNMAQERSPGSHRHPPIPIPSPDNLNHPHLRPTTALAMAPECRPCANLTLDKLLLFAEEEYSGCTFPTKAYYEHHPSFNHLEQAAKDGCDLCRLILDCFKGSARDHYTWPPEWEEPDGDVEGPMYAAAKRLDVSDVKLALDSSTAFAGAKGVSVFDVMMVQVGRRSEVEEEDDADDYEGDFWDQRVPPLRLTLCASPGEFNADGSVLPS